jgi:hypothetical protein
MNQPRTDYLFNTFLGVLCASPTLAALWFKSAWWLLLYVPVLLIVGL